MDGPFLWAGPLGDGHCWRTDFTRPLEGEDAIGKEWVSDLDEVRRSDLDELERWWPAPDTRWLCALEAWALAAGFVEPPPPPPPPGNDSDGDGVPDEQDADPNDPNVQ